jgi:hypothetical protein
MTTERVLTDADLVDIRDAHLPSQGESFDTNAYGRAVEAAVLAKVAARVRSIFDRDCVIFDSELRIPFATHAEAFAALSDIRAALASAPGAQDDAKRYREALAEIAGISNRTAADAQFVRHLQRMAARALNGEDIAND